MAGLALGNLLEAVTQATTALSKERGVKQFINTINKFGIQVQNNFEVNFSGLQDATFFIQTIDIPQTKQNFTQLNYDGRVVDVPINHDWEHNFSMTVFNDAQGYIYSALLDFVMSTSSERMMNSGYTMTIKALTGDPKYAGALITMRGVRLESVGSLSWAQDGNAVQTFTISGKLIDFTYTPGALKQTSGLLGAVGSMFGS